MLKPVSPSQRKILLSTRDESITWIELRNLFAMVAEQAWGSLEKISLVVQAYNWAVLFLPETTWLFIRINFTKMGRVLIKFQSQQIFTMILIG